MRGGCSIFETRSFGSLRPLNRLGIGTAEAAEPNVEAESPPPVSESVLRVQLAKRGYDQIQKLELNGEFWEATVTKNGKTEVLRFHAQNGARLQETR